MSIPRHNSIRKQLTRVSMMQSTSRIDTQRPYPPLVDQPDEGVTLLDEHCQIHDLKGVEPNKCVICGCLSRFVCRECSWVDTTQRGARLYAVSYCTRQHAMTDKFHLLVCEEMRKLKLRPMEQLLNYEKQVEEKRKDRNRKKILFENIMKIAKQVSIKSKYATALQGATFLSKMASHFFGNGQDNTQLAEAELFKAYCCIKLGDLNTAVLSMSRVQNCFDSMGDQEVPVITRANIDKMNGMIRLEKGDREEALVHFSNEVYTYTMAYGTTDRRTGTALYHLADVFRIRGDTNIASSIYRQVTDNWVKYLSNAILEKSNKKCQKEATDPGLLVEGLEVMFPIFEFRKGDEDFTADIDQMMSQLALAILYHFQGEHFYAMKLANSVMTIATYPDIDIESKTLALEVCHEIAGVTSR